MRKILSLADSSAFLSRLALGQEIMVVVGMGRAEGDVGACLIDGPWQTSADKFQWHLHSGSGNSLRELWAFFLPGSVSV